MKDNPKKQGRPLTSIRGFIDRVENIVNPKDSCASDNSGEAGGYEFYFRGHFKKSYKITPSIFRSEELRKSEHLLFREIVATNPAEFQNDDSTLEKLARMQHHSCPTRLLDVSSNPLVALYFACKEMDKSEGDLENGEVIVFKVKKDLIKFYDSDTVSLISNISRLSNSDKDELNEKIKCNKNINESNPGKRLLHFIRDDKPYFEGKFNEDDVNKVVLVKSKLNSKRIVAQSGAFLVFGQIPEIDKNKVQGIDMERILISGGSKEKIIRSLGVLGINHGSLFMDIDSYALHFKSMIGS